ncbi:thiamine pyrophosphate-binding protein [Thalassomonas haliotis]|uniref:Thiamine pyrophosphate-binding protein n=2 Tax=Thalassomonas haliotis TaxID=485448 RepID=A0ABY7VLX6_9GAMM|nr:thiamine pyrophosphate-binding protein [Thalassomonas haliotis]
MAQTLAFFGSRRIYGVGGDFAANLISAFEDELDICPSSNEMHAGFTACGQAEVEGLGVCLTTYTVGSLPCVSAAALALTEKLPVVFISGAPGENEINHMALHHTVSSCSTWRSEYDAALESFKALGIRSERLQGERNPGQPNVAGEHFFRLVAHAFLNKEPVFIEVPRDLVADKTQAIEFPPSLCQLPQEVFLLKGVSLVAQQVVAKLLAANKPLLYLGEKAKLNKELLAVVKRFCHQYQIPYTTTWFAKGVLDEFEPLSLGAYNGVFTDEQVRDYIENEVDYVLEVATSIYQLDTNTAFDTGTHLLNDFENKTILKGTSQLEKDLIGIFEQLLAADLPVFDFTSPTSTGGELFADEKIDFHNLTRVLNSLQSLDQRAYVYFPEIGNSYFASYSLKTRMSSLGRSWITNPWYAAMGTSLPYARAACKQLQQLGGKKTATGKDVAVVITGDGGFNFQLNDLIHFLRDDLSVIIIYMRNDIFHLGKNSDAEIYHCSDKNFDVISLVKAYGGEGKRCTTVAEFRDYFSACADANSGIKLIEVPASLEEQYQCREISLLNLYIKARNGIPQAVIDWNEIKR